MAGVPSRACNTVAAGRAPAPVTVLRRGCVTFLRAITCAGLLNAASGPVVQAESTQLRCGDTVVRLICLTRVAGECVRTNIVFESARRRARVVPGTRHVPQDFQAVTTAKSASCYQAGAHTYVSVLYTFRPAGGMNSYVRFFHLDGRLVRTRTDTWRINQIESVRITGSVSID